MDPHELLLTAARTAAVYLLMLVVMRVMGKRTIGNFSAFDLLVALMMGEVVDEMAYGDVAFLQGATVIFIVGVLHYINSWLSYWDHGIDAVLEGTPTVMVRDGAFVQRGLEKERMNPKDVMALLRLGGVNDLREVRLAMLENDGQLSILMEDWAETAQKADLGGEAAEQKRRDLRERDTGSVPTRTDAPQSVS
jgi:uncharacterized membrane protein YcaP (DUF421 family)